MNKNGLKIKVRVLAVWPLADFRGPVLIAGVRPKFVVAMIMEGAESEYSDEESGVNIPTERVVIFAIDSVARLFIERNIVGDRFTLFVRTTITKDGKKVFLLDLA